MKSTSRRLWKNKPLKSSYDAVIIGGGLHGLAAAYFLASRHGMTDIALIEKRYIGFGGSGRNGGIVRANQRTQENLVLYKEGLALWPQLTRELDFNLMFYNCGNLNLAHTDRALAAMRLHVASAQFNGVDIHMVDAKQCKELVPELDIAADSRLPVKGGMFHPAGGTVRHDAVVWGLAKEADRLGVDIHQQTELTGVCVEGGRVTGVKTNQGSIHTPRILIAAGGYSAGLCRRLLGLMLPVSVLGLQAMVTQPLKPLMPHVVSSSGYNVYATQSLKGEVVTGSHMDTWPNYTTQTTAGYVKHVAESLGRLIPCLRGVRFMRVWGGLADITPDMAPIIDGNIPVKGCYLDCGWGYFGFKSSVVSGKYVAAYLAEDKCPEILEPFALRRFEQHRLMGETAAAVDYSAHN